MTEEAMMMDDTEAGLGPEDLTDVHDPPDTPPSWAWSETEPEPVWHEPHRRRVIPAVAAILVGSGLIAGAVVHFANQATTEHPDTSPVTTTPVQAAPSPEPSPEPTPSPEPKPTYDAGPTAEHLVPPAPQLTADQRFLALLAEDGWNVTDPQQAETAGHLACTGLSASHNLLTTENWLHNTYGILTPQAHAVTIAASVVYCPEIPG